MCDVNMFPEGNTIEIHIEDDGTVTLRTAGISKEIHKTAEQFLETLAKELGATVDSHQHEAKTIHRNNNSAKATVRRSA